MCDNLTETVAELEARGADFTRGIRDDGYALTIALKVPSAGEMMLYEPKHPHRVRPVTFSSTTCRDGCQELLRRTRPEHRNSA